MVLAGGFNRLRKDAMPAPLLLAAAFSLLSPVGPSAVASIGQAGFAADKAGLVALTTTVGTNTSVCSSSDTVTVSPSSAVTLCYTISNLSPDVTYEVHSLSDSVLGDILVDSRMPWLPRPRPISRKPTRLGEASFMTQPGLLSISTPGTWKWLRTRPRCK